MDPAAPGTGPGYTPLRPIVRRSLLKSICICCAVPVGFRLGWAVITLITIIPIHAPRYAIDDVHIKLFNMNAADNVSTLNANITYTVRANNRNRNMGIKYNWINIDTSYAAHNFGHSSTGKFSQGGKMVAAVTSEFNVQGFAFSDKNVATALANDINNSSVRLRAFAKAKMRVTIGSWYKSLPLSVVVDCDLVVVPPSPPNPYRVREAMVLSKTCKLRRPRYRRSL